MDNLSGRSVIVSILVLAFIGTMAKRISTMALIFKSYGLGISAFHISLYTTAFMITRSIFSPIAGYLGDLKGYGKIATLGALIEVVNTPVYIVSRSVNVFMILSAVDGIASGLLWPSLQTLMVYLAGRLVSTLMAVYFICGNIGILLAYYTYAQMLAGKYSFAFQFSTFEFALCLMIALFAIWSFKLRAPLTPPCKSDGSRGRLAIKSMSIALALLISFFTGFIMSSTSLIVLYLHEFKMFSEKLVSLLMSYSFMLGLPLMLLINYASDVGDWLLTSIIASIASLAGLMLLKYSKPGSILMATLSLTLFYSSFRGFAPLSRAMTGRVVAKRKGLAIGFVNTISNIGSIIGPAILGYLYVRCVSLFEEALILSVAILTIILIVVKVRLRGRK